MTTVPSPSNHKARSNPYGWDWPEVRQRELDRAGHRCENCGCESRPRNVLTVHHLDWNPSNHDPSNLVVFCQVCHLRIQRRFRPGQLAFWPPPWLK